MQKQFKWIVDAAICGTRIETRNSSLGVCLSSSQYCFVALHLQVTPSLASQIYSFLSQPPVNDGQQCP